MNKLNNFKQFNENLNFNEIEDESGDWIKIGSSVFVDPDGPATLGYSDSTGETRRDKPFKPKFYKTTKGKKYEVIFVDNNEVTIYNDDGEFETVSVKNVSLNENHYFQKGQSQEEIDWFNNIFDPILERLYKKAGQGCDKDAFIKGAITAIMSLNGEFDLIELEAMFD